MGDVPVLPTSSPKSLDVATVDPAPNEQQDHSKHFSPNPNSPSNDVPFYPQLSSIPQAQLRPDLHSPAHPTSPHHSLQKYESTSLNMGAMVVGLPDYASVDTTQRNSLVPQHSQRQWSSASPSSLVHQPQQNTQASSSLAPQTHSPYGPGFDTGQFQGTFIPAQPAQHANYAAFPPGQQHMGAPASMQAAYQNFPQYVYYPTHHGAQLQYSLGYAGQSTYGQAAYGRRPSLPNSHMQLAAPSMKLTQHEGSYPQSRMTPGSTQGEQGMVGSVFGGPFMQAQEIQYPGPVSSIPRGPPRKPKQSGHALWVGNLPPGISVVDLKDHFSRDATRDIQSLFLISKSNCAFVNYRTEDSCIAAIHRFHDSQLNGARLVCRFRRSSTPTSGARAGQSAATNAPVIGSSTQVTEEDDVEGAQVEGGTTPLKTSEETRTATTSPKKYFIVKSLTLQDLELSVRNGIWATQSHNEESLNEAYETAKDVYLIFSANKSGEYFGYARMASPILKDANHLIDSAPKSDDIMDRADVPKSIPTPATEFAPKGRIIDDSARGTIFWEAELTDSEGEEEQRAKEEQPAHEDVPAVAQSWGKPFKVEWISTNRLPFYHTRGLRNPWNANREVKIARDGTELEPNVGERLVQMFHLLGTSGSTAPTMQPPQFGVRQMHQF